MRFLRAGFAAGLILAALMPAVTIAQTPLLITTPYPSVVNDPGATAKFPVTVTTETPQRVDLSVAGQPDGWTTNLRGGGSTIAAVYTTGTPVPSGQTTPSTVTAQFQVEVVIPATATPGANKVTIAGHAADGSTANLELDITIQQQTPGDVTMTAGFPELQGPTSTSFRFDLQLHNDTNQQITFTFETDAPDGWTVNAQPSGQTQAATAVADAGSLTAVQVTAKAPSDTAAGAYPITVRALGGPQPVETQLSVKITGTFAMSLDTSDSRLNAQVTAGSPTNLTLVVSNTGTAPLTAVSISSSPPQGWTVTFDTPTIDQIAPGATANVNATIQPANNAIAGDYVITIRARSGDQTDSVDIRTTVQTSPIGGLLGIAVLVLVAVGLFFVFQRYGRR
jgi:uncharacterized repeat protein (TIGR01451 family)